MKRSADDLRWQAVQERDRGLDGQFVFGVTSTRIFCRPSCPSRRPKRENVRFYSSSPEAERAGFRACLRCHPKSAFGSRVERAVRDARIKLDAAAASPATGSPTGLKSLAKTVGVSAFHLQRHFKRIVGLTPRAYLSKKRSTLLRENLRKGATVLHAIYESGFNSPSRAYAAAGKELGMSPTSYKKKGMGIEISYRTAVSSFGRVIVGNTQRGVCAVMIGASEKDLVAQLSAEFPNATLRKGDGANSRVLRNVIQLIDKGRAREVALDVGGTPFQWKVWEALRKIPVGQTRTYGEIAREIGRPGAARAVGRACAANRAAVLIPCHRVVRGDGGSGEYRWGAALKRRLLNRETGPEDE